MVEAATTPAPGQETSAELDANLRARGQQLHKNIRHHKVLNENDGEDWSSRVEPALRRELENIGPDFVAAV